MDNINAADTTIKYEIAIILMGKEFVVAKNQNLGQANKLRKQYYKNEKVESVIMRRVQEWIFTK